MRFKIFGLFRVSFCFKKSYTRINLTKLRIMLGKQCSETGKQVIHASRPDVSYQSQRNLFFRPTEQDFPLYSNSTSAERREANWIGLRHIWRTNEMCTGAKGKLSGFLRLYSYLRGFVRSVDYCTWYYLELTRNNKISEKPYRLIFKLSEKLLHEWINSNEVNWHIIVKINYQAPFNRIHVENVRFAKVVSGGRWSDNQIKLSWMTGYVSQ